MIFLTYNHKKSTQISIDSPESDKKAITIFCGPSFSHQTPGFDEMSSEKWDLSNLEITCSYPKPEFQNLPVIGENLCFAEKSITNGS